MRALKRSFKMIQTAIGAPAAAHNPQRTFSTKYGRYKDLCEAFSVSRTTLWRWIDEPGFPKPIKRGNTVLFDVAAVEAWLAGGEA